MKKLTLKIEIAPLPWEWHWKLWGTACFRGPPTVFLGNREHGHGFAGGWLFFYIECGRITGKCEH